MLRKVFCARDVKSLVLFAACLLWRQKNRSEAEPGAARPGAQINWINQIFGLINSISICKT